MKKFLFVSLVLTSQVEARQIVLDIPDEEIALVETYVVDAEQWIKDAWKGKVNNRADRLFRDEIEHCINTGASLPHSKEEAIQNGMKRLKTRKERDALEKIEVTGKKER
jgi:hypothetical protein